MYRTLFSFSLIWLVYAAGAAQAVEPFSNGIHRVCGSLGSTESSCRPVGSVEKQILVDDIAHYSLRLRVGPQDEDVVRVHRVVREIGERPVATRDGVFLVHGNLFGFAQTYLAGFLSPEVPADRSMAIFLAARDVDVWGIDLRWTQVPAETEDLDFMASWNIGTDVGDVRKVMLVARAVRAVTGSGAGKLHLGGWSSGGIIGYALANLEAKLPAAARHARTLIPMDTMYRIDPAFPEVVESACNRYALAREAIDSGIFHSDEGSQVAGLTQLAVSDPDGASPAVPGLTNRQAILFLVGVFPDPNPLVPAFHQLAVASDGAGVPQGLRFSPEPFMNDFLLSAAPFISLGQRADFEQIFCGRIPSVHADSLDRISLPVLYLGAEGGFGSFGTYTQDLLASTDVTQVVVSFETPGDRSIDLGHSELFLGDDAQALFWQVMLDWLRSR